MIFFNCSFIKGLLRNILIYIFIFVFSCLTPSIAFAAFDDLGGADPGSQLNQLENQFKQEELMEQLKKNLKNQMEEAVDKYELESKSNDSGSDLAVEVKQIIFSESLVLSNEELDKLASPYTNRKVTLKELNKLVTEVDNYYASKGYAVCRAQLPEQTIRDGIIRVTLYEGKTGNVILEGSRFTRDDYVLSRIGLKRGTVNNIKDLNSDVSTFNATNDAQLSVKLMPGKETGYTDYLLKLDEPQQNTFSIYSDNSGSFTTGEIRLGGTWTTNSLFGLRDSFSLSYMWSEGSDSGSASYSLPISSTGTKLNLSLTGNDIKIRNGNLKDVDVTGNSYSYSVGVSHMFHNGVSDKINADFTWSRQSSKTDFMRFAWVDNIIYKGVLGVSFTHYGRGVVWYHRHAFAFHSFTDIEGTEKDYFIYNLNFIRQQALLSGNTFTIKFNAQWTCFDYIASADQFYIGGVSSVRGYAESLLGGETGISGSLEYSIPIRSLKNLALTTFVDWGRVYGASSLLDRDLCSAGIGLRWSTNDSSFGANLWLGFPLVKKSNGVSKLNGNKIDDARLHFSAYLQL